MTNLLEASISIGNQMKAISFKFTSIYELKNSWQQKVSLQNKTD